MKVDQIYKIRRGDKIYTFKLFICNFIKVRDASAPPHLYVNLSLITLLFFVP